MYERLRSMVWARVICTRSMGWAVAMVVVVVEVVEETRAILKKTVCGS